MAEPPHVRASVPVRPDPGSRIEIPTALRLSASPALRGPRFDLQGHRGPDQAASAQGRPDAGVVERARRSPCAGSSELARRGLQGAVAGRAR